MSDSGLGPRDWPSVILTKAVAHMCAQGRTLLLSAFVCLKVVPTDGIHTVARRARRRRRRGVAEHRVSHRRSRDTTACVLCLCDVPMCCACVCLCDVHVSCACVLCLFVVPVCCACVYLCDMCVMCLCVPVCCACVLCCARVLCMRAVSVYCACMMCLCVADDSNVIARLRFRRVL